MYVRVRSQRTATAAFESDFIKIALRGDLLAQGLHSAKHASAHITGASHALQDTASQLHNIPCCKFMR